MRCMSCVDECADSGVARTVEGGGWSVEGRGRPGAAQGGTGSGARLPTSPSRGHRRQHPQLWRRLLSSPGDWHVQTARCMQTIFTIVKYLDHFLKNIYSYLIV